MDIRTSTNEAIVLTDYLDIWEIEDRDDLLLASEEIAAIQESELSGDLANQETWTTGDDVIW